MMLKSALQICSDPFLNHFQTSFKETLNILAWNRELGTKDRLNAVKAGSLYAIFIGNDLSYNKESLLCWTRALENGGLLLLEASPETIPQLIQEISLNTLTFVDTHNRNVWAFQKHIDKNAVEIYGQIDQAIRSKAPVETILALLEHYEMLDPNASLPFFIRQRLLADYHLPTLVNNDWQRHADRALPSSSQMYVILSNIIEGDYYNGFRKREMILGNRHLRRTPTPPDEHLYAKRWKGESLTGKSMVVWTEFGLGDEIMFAQLAHYLKTQGASQLTWIAQSPIVELLKTHPDIDCVIDSKHIQQSLGDFDYWVYPHEILAYVPMPFEYVPKRLPYLSANMSKVQEMAALFPDSDNLKVGIVWRGDPSHENDRYRSIHRLEYIEMLFQMEEIDWYCLQKACNESEIALLAKYNVPHSAKDYQDFTETAAALKQLDCLVAVDTSVVHLAGAMGIPSLIMLPYPVDWRWGTAGKTNKWYTSIEAFRNSISPMDWSCVIEEVKQALKQRITWKKR